jgi:hypothetical protein
MAGCCVMPIELKAVVERQGRIKGGGVFPTGAK